ncbi:MAG: glycosyltransferase family 2 protein [Puniceicoccales bacterium]
MKKNNTVNRWKDPVPWDPSLLAPAAEGEPISIDVVTVTYNSSKHLGPFFAGLAAIQYPSEKLAVYIADNQSSDDSVRVVEDASIPFRKEVIRLRKNYGFGGGCNRAAARGKGEYVLFLNPDTIVGPDFFACLDRAIAQHPQENVGAWECRQKPFEHPKYYNPATREVEWASGACLLVKRAVLEEIGGFDSSIFLYGEDVDISWMIRRTGRKVLYLPEVSVTHNSRDEKPGLKVVQFIHSVANNGILRWKYGNWADVREFYGYWRDLWRSPPDVPDIRRSLFRRFLKAHQQSLTVLGKRLLSRGASSHFHPRFLHWDYEVHRLGAWVPNDRPRRNASVALVIFSPENEKRWLAETLLSARNQTIPFASIRVLSNSDLSRSFSGGGDEIEFRDDLESISLEKILSGTLSDLQEEYVVFASGKDLFFADLVELVQSYANTDSAAVRVSVFRTLLEAGSERNLEVNQGMEPVAEGKFFELRADRSALRSKGAVSRLSLLRFLQDGRSLDEFDCKPEDGVSVEKTTIQFRDV